METNTACPPSKRLCRFGDKILKGGETVPCGDGCNRCGCVNGEIISTKIVCGKILLSWNTLALIFFH